MVSFEVSSDFGRVDTALIGRPQPLMRDALIVFFNDFIKACKDNNIRHLYLSKAFGEYVSDTSPRVILWPLDTHEFTYLLEDILDEKSDILDVDFILTNRTNGAFLFKLKMKNGGEVSGELSSLYTPNTGLARFAIEFSDDSELQLNHKRKFI